MTDDELKQGLDCYAPEEGVFPTLEGRKLCKGHVLLILKWKLGRIKTKHSETITDTNLEKINQAVADADAACIHRKISALNSLDEIPEIGLPVATAILTACYPEKFTIIDRRVLEQLMLVPTRAEDWTAEDYISTFLPKLQRIAECWGCSLRDADKALWGLSVSKRIKEVIDKSNAGSATPGEQRRVPPHGE